MYSKMKCFWNFLLGAWLDRHMYEGWLLFSTCTYFRPQRNWTCIYIYIYIHTHPFSHLTLVCSVSYRIFHPLKVWKDVLFQRPVCVQYSPRVSSLLYFVVRHPQKYILSLLFFPFVVNFFDFPANLSNTVFKFAGKHIDWVLRGVNFSDKQHSECVYMGGCYS